MKREYMQLVKIKVTTKTILSFDLVIAKNTTSLDTKQL